MEEDIEYNQNLNRDVTNELNIGDNVLYKLKKGTFDKESVEWSKTIYQIVGIDGYKIQIRSKNKSYPIQASW